MPFPRASTASQPARLREQRNEADRTFPGPERFSLPRGTFPIIRPRDDEGTGPVLAQEEQMSHEVNLDRRRLLGRAAMTVAAAGLGRMQPAAAQSTKAEPAGAPRTGRGKNSSFASVKQIDAGLLNVGYAEAGPPGGP